MCCDILVNLFNYWWLNEVLKCGIIVCVELWTIYEKHWKLKYNSVHGQF